MQNVFVGPAMPVYSVGNVGVVVIAPPNQDTVFGGTPYGAWRAIQSFFVSNLTTPQAPGVSSSDVYTIKIYAYLQRPANPPNFNTTEGLIATFKNAWGHVPVHQLMPGGSAYVYLVIRNHTTNQTIAVWVNGEA